MNKRIIFSFLGLVCLVIGHPVAASSTSADSLLDFPVVLSANVLANNPTKTPLALSIIDKKMIEASGARTIPDALRLIPGIVVGHSVNEFGDKPLIVVSYHGHSDQFSKRMNVLIDGRSIYDPLLGGVNWYNIPIVLDDIERIEVTHGPNASTYGSNSFQAVINVITRHASEDKGHMVKTKFGNHAIFDATYRYADAIDDLDYRFTLSTVNDDGQDRKGGGDAFDDVSAGIFDYRLDYQYNNKNKLTYTGSYGKTDQNTEATLRPNTQPKLPQRVIGDTSAHQLVRWDSTINSRQSFVLKYFYNYLNEADEFNSLPIDLSLVNAGLAGYDDLILPINKSFESQRHNIEFTHFINLNDQLNFTWGVSNQNDSVDSSYYLFPTNKISRDTHRLFGDMVWDINKQHRIDLGFLIEKTKGNKSDVSPRFSYFYHLKKNHFLRFGVSKAVRTPFIFEQSGQISFSATLTDSDGVFPDQPAVDYIFADENNLEPEKITSLELGYSGRFFQDALSVDARLFHDELEDLIHSPFVATTAPENVNGVAFIFDNLYATTTRGVEVELDFMLNNATRFIVNTSLVDIMSDDLPVNSSFEESAPKKSFSILAMHDFNDIYTASMGFYYIGDMSFTDVNNANPTGLINTGIIRKLDFRVARDFKIGNETLSAAVVLQNLLDEYSDYDAIPNSPDPIVVQNLNAFIEVKMKFR